MSEPILVVLRGNSGSGKTTTAREVRRRYGRGCAVLEQDHLRRVVLREHDSTGIGPVAPAFIAATARSALGLGYHVVLEGILHTERYGSVLRELIAGHAGPSHVFYFDIPFGETVRRHLTRSEPTVVTADDMRGWYSDRDLLGVPDEVVFLESVTPDEAVTTVLHGSGLGSTAALTPCPVRCPRCQEQAAQA